jgi:hypothetical protein
LDTYKRIGNNPATDPEVTLAHHEYNELGQLVDKKLHLKEGNTKSLQSVDYRYNIRGWLSAVNDPVLSATPNTRNTDDASSDGDKFGMALDYQDAAIVQYNGHIGSMSWKSAGTAALSFDYRYDKLNRLIHAESSTAGVKDRLYSKYLRYDVMGNIESLDPSAKSLNSQKVLEMTRTP